MAWCDENRIIDESQAGFRPGYSTVDNIFNLQAMIQKYTTKKQERFYVFDMDYLKAFDNCMHVKIWQCLSRNCIDGRCLNIFKSMYSKMKACVKVKNGLTDFLSVKLVQSRAVCLRR